MNRKFYCFMAIGVIGLLMPLFAFAQSERNASAVSELYVISAKAGGVNYTEGKVAVTRNDSRTRNLNKGDQLEIGEVVSTGNSGRAEILLNPGSFVRLGENTDFEFVSTALDDLKIKLAHGSAMFELIADNEFDVSIETPKGGFRAVESGIYRVDVLADGSSKIFVYNGKAVINDRNATVVKKSRTGTVNGNNVSVEKFDRDDKGNLEIWSKDRAKELAKVNSKLQRNDLRNSLLSSYNRQRWGFNDSFGLWAFDRSSSQYCFVPFGYGWGSPYGYFYGRDLWYFRLPRYVYYYPTRNNSSGGSTNTNTSPTANNTTRTERNNTPPFQRVNPGVQRQPSSSPSVNESLPRRSSPPLSIPRSILKGKPDSDN
ncbi:MAG: FecR domain-containing protein [Pyrinomonadaceae bacterium]